MALQVDSLIICGGMAFTFKKTLENVSVSHYFAAVDKHLMIDTRSETPCLMPLVQETSRHSSRRLGRTM